MLTDHERGLVVDLYWSPTGKQVAFTFFTLGETGHMELRLVSTRTKQEITLAALPQQVSFGNVSWSPDEQWLAYAVPENDKSSQIYRVNVATRQVQKLSQSPASIGEDPDWSPGGQWIAFTSNRPLPDSSATGRHVWVMKADGGKPQPVLPSDRNDREAAAYLPAWSPDGGQIAFYSEMAEPIKGNASTGGIRLVGTSRQATASGLWLMDADGGRPEFAAPCSSPTAEAPAWSPDGSRIAFVCGDDTQSSLMIAISGQQNFFKNTGNEGVDYGYSWSPDSQALIYMNRIGDYDRSIHLFDFSEDGPFGERQKAAFENAVWSTVAEMP